MNLIQRVMTAILPARVIRTHTNTIQSQANLEPEGPAYLYGGSLPGTWSIKGALIPPVNRQVRSVILNAAITRLGNEMASAKVKGVDDFPNFPWRGPLRAMAERYYLDGGFIAWIRWEWNSAANDMYPLITVFSPRELTPVGGQEGVTPPTTYTYRGLSIRREELAIHYTPRQPREADWRLRNLISLEVNAIDAQRNATTNAAKPRWWWRRNKRQRQPREDDQLRGAITADEASAETTVANAALVSGDGPANLYEDEEVGVLNVSPDTQFGITRNDIAQMMSADSGVPAQFISSTESLTYANVVQLTRVFYESVIIPLGAEIAAAIRAQGLLPDFNLDFTRHYAVQQTATERAQMVDRQSTAVERLVRAGMDLDMALALAGLGQDDDEAAPMATRRSATPPPDSDSAAVAPPASTGG